MARLELAPGNRQTDKHQNVKRIGGFNACRRYLVRPIPWRGLKLASSRSRGRWKCLRFVLRFLITVGMHTAYAGFCTGKKLTSHRSNECCRGAYAGSVVRSWVLLVLP